MAIVRTASANQLVYAQGYKEGGSLSTQSEGHLIAVKLPSTIEAISVHDSTGGDSFDTTGTNLGYDTQNFIDTDTFTHSTSTNPHLIEVDVDGDYLFLGSILGYRSSGTKRYANIFEWVKSATVYKYGSFGTYSRGSDALTTGCAGGTVIPNLVDGNSIYLQMLKESTQTADPPDTVADGVGVSGFLLSSLAPVVHELTASEVTLGTPAVDAPALTHIHVLTATEVTSGTPVVDAPAISQDHSLTATEVTSGTPAVDAPAISQNHNLTATEITSGTPVVDTPALTHIHVLTATEITSGTPVVDAPALSQVHNLTAAEVTSGTPVVDAPALSQVHNLTATEVTSGTPVVDAPTVSQIHNLTASEVTSGTPVVDAPALTPVHVLTATEVTSGTPVVDAPVLTHIHVLTASEVTSGTPVVDAPVLTAVHVLVAYSITMNDPVVDAPAIGQLHALSVYDIDIGVPVVDTPVFTQVFVLTAQEIFIGVPVVDTPVLSEEAMAYNHSPAQVLRAALIIRGQGELISVDPNTPWPIFVGHLPDEPDNAVCVYDTAGVRDGRIHVTGETIGHPGWQIRVRGGGYDVGYDKMKNVVDSLDTLRQISVVIDSDTYIIAATTRTSGPLSLGQEPDGSRRAGFTVNGTITFTEQV
jgi:hypothetical protein